MASPRTNSRFDLSTLKEAMAKFSASMIEDSQVRALADSIVAGQGSYTTADNLDKECTRVQCLCRAMSVDLENVRKALQTRQAVPRVVREWNGSI